MEICSLRNEHILSRCVNSGALGTIIGELPALTQKNHHDSAFHAIMMSLKKNLYEKPLGRNMITSTVIHSTDVQRGE